MPYPVLHKSNRIYVFGLQFNGQIWIDDDESMIDFMIDKLSAFCADMTYSSIKVQSVLSNEEVSTNIHIDGVKYLGSVDLTVNEIDIIRVQMLAICNSSPEILHDRIDIVNDQFYEDPTPGY